MKRPQVAGIQVQYSVVHFVAVRSSMFTLAREAPMGCVLNLLGALKCVVHTLDIYVLGSLCAIVSVGYNS